MKDANIYLKHHEKSKQTLGIRVDLGRESEVPRKNIEHNGREAIVSSISQDKG